ncbi:MAG: hypothetical protein LBO09_03880 [Candidatus Peribacteria bacterium]|jgi:hypothetical protein|nr:hypothetical protein [Candidatus Peribacteria bacterium]
MLDSLYKREDGEYVDRNRDERQKGKESTTDAHSLISAEPKNIQFTNRRGRLDQINIVTNVSKAKPEWLEELAPHLIAKKKNADKWDDTTQQVVYQEDTHFNGLHIASKDLESPLSSQGILQFCNALARGYVEKDQEKLRYIYEHNQKVREEISQLRNRFPGIRELSYSDLSDYYWEVIHNSGIQSTKALQQYLETHGIEIFLLNEPKFLIRNYDKLPQWYPEEIQVKDQKYRVKYNLGWYGDFSIKIQIPLQDLDQLSQKDFSPELFRKQPYSFTILDEKGDSLTSVSDLDVYKEKIKAERLQKKRNDFEKSYTSQLQSKDFASRDGQREVQEKLFDAETERFAYLGILARNYEDTFEEKWFLEKNEAQDATQKTQEKYQAYVQKQQDISRFEVVYQEVQTLYQGIDKKLNEDRDWGTT